MAPDSGQRKSGMIYAKVCQAVVQYEGLLSHLAVRIAILTLAGAAALLVNQMLLEY